jgi:hypothetical protein
MPLTGLTQACKALDASKVWGVMWGEVLTFSKNNMYFN